MWACRRRRIAHSPRNVGVPAAAHCTFPAECWRWFRALHIPRGIRWEAEWLESERPRPPFRRVAPFPAECEPTGFRAAGHRSRYRMAYTHDVSHAMPSALEACSSIRMSHESRCTCRFHLTRFSGLSSRASWTIFSRGLLRAKHPAFVAERCCGARVIDVSRRSPTCCQHA
jgi:hypothetical protein